MSWLCNGLAGTNSATVNIFKGKLKTYFFSMFSVAFDLPLQMDQTVHLNFVKYLSTTWNGNYVKRVLIFIMIIVIAVVVVINIISKTLLQKNVGLHSHSEYVTQYSCTLQAISHWLIVLQNGLKHLLSSGQFNIELYIGK